MRPITNLETLIAQVKLGVSYRYLYFWDHRAPGETLAQCLSQWFPAPFDLDGVHYATAEHYMMAAKARLFGDSSSLQQILCAADPAQAKALGRQIRGFDATRWYTERCAIVVTGNLAKFSQHPALGAELLSSADCILVEASPFDRIWGIGLAADHPDAQNPLAWRGLNLLGFALMVVRETLRQSATTQR